MQNPDTARALRRIYSWGGGRQSLCRLQHERSFEGARLIATGHVQETRFVERRLQCFGQNLCLNLAFFKFDKLA